MEGNTALISIHPMYAKKILSGEKSLEFRRRWTSQDVDFLVIYATSPVRQIIAIAEIAETFRGNKTQLWDLAKCKGGGISQKKLFEYMEGRQEGVAIELINVIKITNGLSLSDLFGADFQPPQSFRYLNATEQAKLAKQLRKNQ